MREHATGLRHRAGVPAGLCESRQRARPHLSACPLSGRVMRGCFLLEHPASVGRPRPASGAQCPSEAREPAQTTGHPALPGTKRVSVHQQARASGNIRPLTLPPEHAASRNEPSHTRTKSTPAPPSGTIGHRLPANTGSLGQRPHRACCPGQVQLSGAPHSAGLDLLHDARNVLMPRVAQPVHRCQGSW